MTERKTPHQIYGRVTEHRGKFVQAFNYHPLNRRLHHYAEFDADYAMATEICAKAVVTLGTKQLDESSTYNDWGGYGDCLREAAREAIKMMEDLPGAIIKIEVEVETRPMILAPIEDPSYRRQGCEMPHEWYLAEERSKLEDMLERGGWSVPNEKYPKRIEKSKITEIVWSSDKQGDLSKLSAFCQIHEISDARIAKIRETLGQ